MARTVWMVSAAGVRMRKFNSDAGPTVGHLLADVFEKNGRELAYDSVRVINGTEARLVSLDEDLSSLTGHFDVILNSETPSQHFCVLDQENAHICCVTSDKGPFFSHMLDDIADQLKINQDQFVFIEKFEDGKVLPLNNITIAPDADRIYITADISSSEIGQAQEFHSLPSRLDKIRISDLVKSPEFFKKCEDGTPLSVDEQRMVAQAVAKELLKFCCRRTATMREKELFLAGLFRDYPRVDIHQFKSRRTETNSKGPADVGRYVSGYFQSAQRRRHVAIEKLAQLHNGSNGTASTIDHSTPTNGATNLIARHFDEQQPSTSASPELVDLLGFAGKEHEDSFEEPQTIRACLVSFDGQRVRELILDLQTTYRQLVLSAVELFEGLCTSGEIEYVRVVNGTTAMTVNLNDYVVYEDIKDGVLEIISSRKASSIAAAQVLSAPSKALVVAARKKSPAPAAYMGTVKILVIDQDYNVISRCASERGPNLADVLADAAVQTGFDAERVLFVDRCVGKTVDQLQMGSVVTAEHIAITIDTTLNPIGGRGAFELLPECLLRLSIDELINDLADYRILIAKAKTGAEFTEEEVNEMAGRIAAPLQAYVVRRMASTNERRLFVRHLFRDYLKAGWHALLKPNPRNNHSPLSYRIYRLYIAQRGYRFTAIRRLCKNKGANSGKVGPKRKYSGNTQVSVADALGVAALIGMSEPDDQESDPETEEPAFKKSAEEGDGDQPHANVSRRNSNNSQEAISFARSEPAQAD